MANKVLIVPKIYDVIEVCNLTGLSKRTIWRYVREGKLKAYKLGRKYYFSKDTIEGLYRPVESKIEKGANYNAVNDN